MSKKNFWRYLMTAMVIMALISPVACKKIDDPVDEPEDIEQPENPGEEEEPEEPQEPETPETPEVDLNTLVMGETVIELASVAVSDMEMDGTTYMYVAAAQEAGLETPEAVFEADNYAYILVDQALVGTEFDMMTESKTWSATLMWDEQFLQFGTGETSAITEGTCIVTDKGEDRYEFFARFTADGTGYAVRVEGVYVTSLAPRLDLDPETFYVNGTVTNVGSKVLGESSGYIYLAATPTPGLTTIDEVMGEEDYMYVLVSPSQIGTEFDVMTESSTFTISGAWTGVSEYFAIAVDINEDVRNGRCLVEQTGEDTYSFSFVATLADGTVIGMLSEGVLEEEVNNNTITVNDQSKVLRSAFYMVDDDMHTVYFTASEVDTFYEMAENAWQYAFVMVTEEYMTGETVDLEDMSTGVMVGLMDNLTGGYYMATEGSLKITCTGEGEYEVSLAGVALSDIYGENPDATLELDFTGTAISVDYVPEKQNEIVFNDENIAILEAVIEKTSSSVWTISLVTSDETVKITMPASCFGEELAAYGFSQYPETMEIAYGPHVWNADGGGIGTVKLALNGSELDVEFTTYGDISGYFKGEAVVK